VAANPNFHLLPPCKEKQRLRSIYAQAVERHNRLVNEVTAVRGKVSKEEYERVRALADNARNARTVARQALEQHKREHRC
jgi:hypothetical protein